MDSGVPAKAVNGSSVKPLADLKVLEFAGLGPAPFAGMMLADLGAQVLCIDRAGASDPPLFDPDLDVLQRGKHRLALNLKAPADLARARSLMARADVLIEGFRPGVMERLGLGPDEAAFPRLIYGRMTGWGQSGPLAQTVGHDLNYLALSGLLHGIGRREGGPVPPLNLVADFGGGAMLLVAGVLAALHARTRTGQGQVIDAAMVDGCALLMNMLLTQKAMGDWRPTRQNNLLDGGAPFYDTYVCADGQWLAVACIEPAFYRAFLQALGRAQDPTLVHQNDRDQWPVQKAMIAGLLATRPREAWLDVFAAYPDACVSPVLTPDEAAQHPHLQARQSFVQTGGVLQGAAAPRFSQSPTTASDWRPELGSGSTAWWADTAV